MLIYSYTTGPLMVNTYLAYDEVNKNGFIVDPGGFSGEIVSKIEEENISLDYIILTHGHSDHIGGVEMFRRQYPDAKVIAHKDEAPVLANGDLNISTMVVGSPIVIYPDILVADGETLKIGSMELKFIHTPGHTPGGMSIYTDGYLFSGDTLFCESIGRTDFPGGDFNAIIKSIREKLLVYPDSTEVLPGHMSTTNIGHERAHNMFLR